MDGSDWMKGIFFSVLASIIGASSKLAIRKSWLIEASEVEQRERVVEEEEENIIDEYYYNMDDYGDDNDEENNIDSQRQRQPQPQHQHQHQQQSALLRTSSSSSISDTSSYHTAAACSNPNEPTICTTRDDEEETVPTDEPEHNSADCDNVGNTATRQRQHITRRSRVASTFLSRSSRNNVNNASNTNSGHAAEAITSPPTTTSTRQTLRVFRKYCCTCCTMAHFLRYSGMFGMTILNPLACVIAMNYASPSLLAPFSGLTLVWVIIFSKPIVGEVPTLAQQIASSFIIIGEVMVATFGDHTGDSEVTMKSLIDSYKEPALWLYFVCLLLWMLLLTFWICMPVVTSSSLASYWCSSTPTLKRFAWGASGGSINGLQNFLKDSLVAIKLSPSWTRIPWFVFIFILLQIAASFGGLLFLTVCMKRYDAAYSAAMFVGSFVISTSIMSAVHYHTFRDLSDLMDLIMYPLGLVILVIGVSILARQDGAHTTTATTTRGRTAAITEVGVTDDLFTNDSTHGSITQVVMATSDRTPAGTNNKDTSGKSETSRTLGTRIVTTTDGNDNEYVAIEAMELT